MEGLPDAEVARITRSSKTWSDVGGKAMPDRDGWFHEKAPYSRRARRRLVRRTKPKPSVLKEDLLDLPLGENREVQPDTDEPSDDDSEGLMSSP